MKAHQIAELIRKYDKKMKKTGAKPERIPLACNFREISDDQIHCQIRFLAQQAAKISHCHREKAKLERYLLKIQTHLCYLGMYTQQKLKQHKHKHST